MPKLTTLEILRELIAFPTISSDSNLPLIHFVANYLDDLGISCTVLESETQPKANLYANIGPQRDGGIMLSGHTDVVPTEGQQWSSAPFKMRIMDNRIYGRGSADMKGFIAASLSRLSRETIGSLKYPIQIALSYDEEIGCLGVPDMISYIKAEAPQPAAVIIGEPTEMKLVIGHKGTSVFKTEVRGKEAHSSMPHLGDSAVMISSSLIEYLKQLEDEFAGVDGKSPFTPPRSTISVNVINGGKTSNIMAKECSFLWDIREIPDAPADKIVRKFQDYCNEFMLQNAKSDILIKTTSLAYVPPLNIVPDNYAIKLSTTLLRNKSHKVMSIGSEAGLFQAAGYASVLCGPGSIEQAHKPDEYVESSQLLECENFVDGLIQAMI